MAGGIEEVKVPQLSTKEAASSHHRLLHMLTAPENELIVLNKEANELELMEQTLEAYLEEKSERRRRGEKWRGGCRVVGEGKGKRGESWWMRLCVRKMIVCT